MKRILKLTQTFLDHIGQHLTPRRMRWFYIYIGLRFFLWVMMVVTQATVLSKGKWTQYLMFLSTARLTDQGYYPFISHWTEYPPVFPWINVGLYRLSLWIIDGPSSTILFFSLHGLILVLCEIGILIFIYRIVCYLANKHLATVAAFIFAVTSWPTYLFYGWFDPIASFLFTFALEKFLRRQFSISAITVGIGFLTKLFPVILIATVLRVEASVRKRILYILVSFGVIALIMLPFFILGPEFVLAQFRWLSSKSTYQTVYALIDGYFSYGVAPFEANFIDPDYAGWIHHPSRVSTVWVTLVFATIGLYVYTRPLPANKNIAILVLTGLIMQLLLLYFKGYSPQYIIWFLPLVVIILPDARGLWYSLSFVILNAFEYPLYFTFWEHIPPILVVIILARTIFWILLTFEYWGIYRGRIETPLVIVENT